MKQMGRSAVAASLALAVATAQAQTTQTVSEAKAPSVSELAKALLPASKDGAIKIKGYVQGRYTSYDESGKSDGFTVKSAYIVPHGTIAPDWNFEAEIDAADTVGKVLRNGFIEYTGFGPRARIRAGQQKPFYAEEFWTSSSAIDTIERSKAVTTLSAERDIGVNLLGKAAADRIEYGIGVFNGSGINASDVDDGKDLAGRVVFTPFKGADTAAEGLRFGGGAWTGDRDAGDLARYTALISYQAGPVKLQSEYLFQNVDAYTMTDTNGAPLAVAEKEGDGWYVLGVCDVWSDGDASVQLAGKYEAYEPNKDAANDEETAVTLGANLFFNSYAKLMLNYKIKDEDKEVDNDEVIAQLQVRF